MTASEIIDRIGTVIASHGCDCPDDGACSQAQGEVTCEDLGHEPCLACRIQRIINEVEARPRKDYVTLRHEETGLVVYMPRTTPVIEVPPEVVAHPAKYGAPYRECVIEDSDIVTLGSIKQGFVAVRRSIANPSARNHYATDDRGEVWPIFRIEKT